MNALEYLSKVAETYRSLMTYQVQSQTLVQAKVAGELAMRLELSSSFAFIRPDRVRFEVKGGGADLLTIQNGRQVTTYHPLRRRYSESAGLIMFSFSPGNWHAGGIGELFYDSIGNRVRDAKIVRQEVLSIAGSDVLCAVIDVAYEPSSGGEIEPFRFWIDSERFVVLKRAVTIKETADTETEITSVVGRVAVNQKVQESLFRFQAPRGVTKVDGPPE